MDKIIQELVEAANILDNRGHSKFADFVDKIADTALDVKVAQYVGIQGYWVRNTRCWGNCIRQKRASSPTKPTQEVWAECHKEYLNYVGDTDTSWDKYATSNEGLIKSAEAKISFNKSLQSKIDSKISHGLDVRSAVVASLDEQKGENFDRLIAASNDLVRMADNLSEDDLDLSLRLASAAAGLSKVARWWHPADWMGGMGDWANKSRAEYADSLQQRSQEYMNKEKGRNNPFLGGGSSIPASNADAGMGGGMGAGSPMGGMPKSNPPKGGIPSSPPRSTFDGDGMPANPPVDSSGLEPGSKPNQGLVGKDELGPELFGEGEITLIPAHVLDELNPAQAKEYFMSLLKAQERINSQISSIRGMYGSGYRKSKGWGDSGPEVAPPAGPGATTPPPPNFSSTSISGPSDMGSMGDISGPTGGFGPTGWSSTSPKPKKRLSHPPAPSRQPASSIV